MAERLSKNEYVCPKCGYMGRAEILLRGSASTERLMWYVLMFPGPFYSIWRRMKPRLRCRQCRRQQLVELDTPEGLALMEKFIKEGAPRLPHF